jgi:hypothetical protein
MIAAIIALQQLGYEVQADGDQLRLRWRGEGKPPRDQVVPLLNEVKRRKVEILAALTTPAMTGGIPAAPTSTMTASSLSAAADPVASSLPKVQPAGGDPVPAEDAERCGWCGSTRLWHADTGSGRIYCEACHAVYNPFRAAGPTASGRNNGSSLPQGCSRMAAGGVW